MVTAVGPRGVPVLPRVDWEINKDRDLARIPHPQMGERIVLQLETPLKLKRVAVHAQVRNITSF